MDFGSQIFQQKGQLECFLLLKSIHRNFQIRHLNRIDCLRMRLPVIPHFNVARQFVTLPYVVSVLRQLYLINIIMVSGLLLSLNLDRNIFIRYKLEIYNVG